MQLWICKEEAEREGDSTVEKICYSICSWRRFKEGTHNTINTRYVMHQVSRAQYRPCRNIMHPCHAQSSNLISHRGKYLILQADDERFDLRFSAVV